MDVSIIIVNYNTEKLILDCLDSIYEKTEGLEFEVIVVDNDSPNKPDILKNDKRIRYIQSETNLGFGKANNLGAKYAKGEYLFCLNPDTLLINNAINILYDYIEDKNDVGACGPNLYKDDMTPNLSFSMLPISIYQELVDSRNFTYKRLNKAFNDTEQNIEVKFSSGAALMIRKNLFDKIGGFNSNFFMYYEDNDICYEIIKKEFKIVNVPSSKIIHLDGRSFTFNKNREILSLKGRKIYYIKNFGITYYYISNIIFILNNSINMIYLLLKGNCNMANTLWFKIKKVMTV